MRKKRFIKGFTLIELIIAVGILGITSIVLTDILINSLRGENKINIVNQSKQAGQTVLEKLTNEIRQAEYVICPKADPSNRLVIKKGNDYLYYALVISESGNNYIAMNYLSDTDIKSIEDSQDCQNSISNPFVPIPPGGVGASDVGDGGDPTPTPTPVPLFGTYLTDINTVTGVSIEPVGDGMFTRNTGTGSKDSVTIKFRVKPGVNAGQTPENTLNEEGILFQTTVLLRGGRYYGQPKS